MKEKGKRNQKDHEIIKKSLQDITDSLQKLCCSYFSTRNGHTWCRQVWTRSVGVSQGLEITQQHPLRGKD